MADEKSLVKSDIIASVVLQGDISKLTQQQKVEYYTQLCKSLDLNPATMPFSIMRQQGKEILYGNKNLAEQLRKNHEISFTDVQREIVGDLVVVTVKAIDKTGRTDADIGAVNIANLKGDALANAIMKATTKAKRRVSLSICGMGMLDETEVETIQNAEAMPLTKAFGNERIDPFTGEVLPPPAPIPTLDEINKLAKDGGLDADTWKRLAKSCEITKFKNYQSPVHLRALKELVEKEIAAKKASKSIDTEIQHLDAKAVKVNMNNIDFLAGLNDDDLLQQAKEWLDKEFDTWDDLTSADITRMNQIIESKIHREPGVES